MSNWRLESVVGIEINAVDHPKGMCKFIMDNRDGIFSMLAFDEYTAVGLFVKKTNFDTLRICDLTSAGSDGIDEAVKALATRAVERFGSDSKRPDALLRGLAKFTLQLRPAPRCRALVDAAVYFAKRHLDRDEQEKWQKHCQAQLSALKTTSNPPHAIPPAELRKRPRQEDFTSSEPPKKRLGDVRPPLVAKMPDIHRIPDFIGTFLFVGLIRSDVRKSDINGALTAALEMHFAPRELEDFTLLITIDKVISDILPQGSLDSMESYLGSWLTSAVRAAKHCHGPSLYPHRNAKDMILELQLGFTHGREISHAIFPQR